MHRLSNFRALLFPFLTSTVRYSTTSVTYNHIHIEAAAYLSHLIQYGAY